MNKGFWMPRDAGCLAEEDTSYDTSSREPKRTHNWLTDASELELFGNKKQAIEAVSSRPVSGISNMNASLCENPSSFLAVPGPFSDRLFGSEMVKTSNLVNWSIPTIGTGNLNLERKGFEDQFGSDSSAGLSISHAIEDPSPFTDYVGARKGKINQARDPENGMHVSIGYPYSRRDDISIPIGSAFNKTDNNISMGQTYSRVEENAVSMGPAFNRMNDNFISMGRTFDIRDGSFMLMGQSFEKGDDSFIVDHRYDKGNGNIVPVRQENFVPMGSAYDKASANFISVGPDYDKEDGNIISVRPSSDNANTDVMSMVPTYDKVNSRILSLGQNYNMEEINTLPLGSFQTEPEPNPSGGIISGYNLVTNQPSAQTSKAPGLGDSAEDNSGPNSSVAPAATRKTVATPKSKEQKPPKNVAPNNFPSNVKSLLSTGMLDGVPVKYFSWTREKNLRGVIKGTGYLCGCNDCKFSKSLNAFEFEHHAGCKTKHPNNHIYFENGKSIYAVVQELKSGPPETIFEAIQNVTGSPINQRNFRAWKASYQAATRELQRIYGKDEVPNPS